MDVIGYDRLVPGDFNRDGRVDAADIVSMLTALADLSAYQSAKNLTGPQMTLLGDLNGDGSVSNADIQALLDLVAGGGGSIAGVPEPSTLILAPLGLVCLILRRSRLGCIATCRLPPLAPVFGRWRLACSRTLSIEFTTKLRHVVASFKFRENLRALPCVLGSTFAGDHTGPAAGARIWFG